MFDNDQENLELNIFDFEAKLKQFFEAIYGLRYGSDLLYMMFFTFKQDIRVENLDIKEKIDKGTEYIIELLKAKKKVLELTKRI